MFFSKKQHQEAEEIKEAIEEPAIEEPMALEKALPDIPEDVKGGASAPLFVKIEKYREVLSSIQEMKIFVSGIKQIFNIIQELEAVRADAVKIMRATLQRLERSAVEVDSELLRPKGFEFTEIQDDMEVHHIADSLNDLQKQLSVLKRELQELR